MEIKELAVLSKKYLAGEASEAEIARLLHWYNAYDEQALTAHIAAADDETEAILEQRMLQRLHAVTSPVRVRKMYSLQHSKWWAAAAVLALLAVGSIYFWQQENNNTIVKNLSLHIKPGRDQAILTLADGREVNLDSTANGLLSLQGSTKVNKTAAGQIVYDHNSAGEPGTAISYNTLRTPRGGQFKVTLPDGTQVWLNAASSITYPTLFTGSERAVTITGEAYFEVAQSAKQPFYVKLKDMEVMVLGTHFNINAYTDESTINTTLLEGAVLVKAGSKAQHITPGQQTRVKRGSEDIALLKQVDVTQAVAWKNGVFAFDNADIPTVMRQLARWYNIEVKYTDKVPPETFNGEIGRSLNEEELLKVLTKAGIHFKIEEGKRIVILP
ncbi:FecR family protein [Chitinophaga niastensis]|uniref:FecR family protein n=1 Tax=Chitinophaga niastensis TaxID=536980 RepID=A0A2P8HP15_CHINA|nr:FecR family protein [Chitinophaga niastensis]PSL47948.1 FecR family protein [Chitinophaga niastensis]